MACSSEFDRHARKNGERLGLRQDSSRKEVSATRDVQSVDSSWGN